MADGDALYLDRVGLLRGQRWLLRDVSWHVPAGRLVAILGPNGCGKSTLARVAGGFEWPTEGRVTLLGHAPGTANLHEVRRQVRLVPPNGQSDVASHLIARDVVLTGLFDAVSPGQREHADDLLMADGRVVARDVLGDVLTDAHLFHAYGLPVTVARHADRYHVGVAGTADLLD